MKHSTIFKSRWMALLWAAGILWVAYDVAAPSDAGNDSVNQADAMGEPVSAEQAQQVGDAFNQL